MFGFILRITIFSQVCFLYRPRWLVLLRMMIVNEKGGRKVRFNQCLLPIYWVYNFFWYPLETVEESQWPKLVQSHVFGSRVGWDGMVCRTALGVRCNPTIVYPQSTRLTIDTSSSSTRQYVKRPCPRSNVDLSIITEEITETSIFVYN